MALLLVNGCESSPDDKVGGSAKAQDSCPAHYKNPLIWEDLPDPEVIRVDDAYYYTASSFHYSPGAPLLRSYDLVHWEYFSHSVPKLDFDESYDLVDGHAYVKGIWASTLAYRVSNKTFYWMGCMHTTNKGYVFTASDPQGPWQKHQSDSCYYDMGLLIEPETDDLYVAFGHGTIYVAKLSDDGFTEERREVVFKTPENLSGPLEGSRFYKIDGDYYIWLTQYANGEYVARSTSGPFGPYELRPLAVKTPFPNIGAGHSPHQGGIVQTQRGDWYYIAFNDAYPGGRLPVMIPLIWKDGWPEVELIDGRWSATYPFPNLPCGADKVKKPSRFDRFKTADLSTEWEWNHNPDNLKWSTGNGLILQTATVTDDIYAARNTLTRRIEGPISSATIELDYSKMRNGDVAGLAVLRNRSAWIGIRKSGDNTRLLVTDNISMDEKWNTLSEGEETLGQEISGGKIWLRVQANIHTDEGGGKAEFFYSLDGVKFECLGDSFEMIRTWPFFLGYRFAIFNYATEALGGEITIERFEIAKR